MRLLHSQPGWADVESAYQEALNQLANDQPANAITDVTRALQLTLEKLGASGNALGPLVKSAKSRGLLRAHDDNLTRGIESFLNWASADRSQAGDAHQSGTEWSQDAWLSIHVVGALIVRLVLKSDRS